MESCDTSRHLSSSCFLSHPRSSTVQTLITPIRDCAERGEGAKERMSIHLSLPDSVSKMRAQKAAGLASQLVRWTALLVWQKLFSFLSFAYFKRLAALIAIRVIGLGLASLQCIFLGISWLRANEERRQSFWKPKERLSVPACLISPTLGRHSYVQLKDVRLHYVEAGDKYKPLLLCLHGFPDFWYSWKNQLRAFSNTHRVIALDLRGYGDSEKPKRASKYHLNVIVEDVRQLIIKLIGNEACVLMGHDFGALVGWMFAATHPNMLTHYVALSLPHPSVFRHYLTQSYKQMFYSWQLFYFQTPWIPEISLASDDNRRLNSVASVGITPDQDLTSEIEAYKYYYSQAGAWSGPVNYFRGMFNPTSLLWQSDAQLRVRVPTILIFGENDKTFSDEHMGLECAKHVDNFQCHLIEGASHYIHREKPEIVNSMIAQFLNVQL